MGFFSRDPEAIDAVRGDDEPFRSLQRPSGNTRGSRKTRPVIDGNLDSPPPLDPAQTAKTRARRRLIGAIALGLAAVVFVPMLFDRTPVATSDDIAIQIPDRDTPFEGRRGVPDSGKPLAASSALPTPTVAPVGPATGTGPSTAADAGLAAGTPAAAAAAASIAAAPDDHRVPESQAAEKVGPAEAVPESKAAATKATTLANVERSPEKAIEKPAAAKTPEKPPIDEAKGDGRKADDPKALAALEGKDAAAETDGGRTYAVQIAAFSATDKARALRDRLVASGLKSYTESVSTSQGLRTRVRLGPFPSRDAADHAKQKLRTLKLDGSVVPL